MAKRFIDTKIWDKAWFRKLPPKTKLIWIYLLTRCDHAGIWDADWELAEFFIGDKVNYKSLPKTITDKMQQVDSGEQFFIPSFIEFQYGELRENSKPHMSVIKRLIDKGLLKSSQTLKDKDKDKVSLKDKKKSKEREFLKKSITYAEELNMKDSTLKEFTSYWTESNENGLKMKFEMQKTFDIKRRMQRWIRNDFGNNFKSFNNVSTNFKKLSSGLYKAYCSKCGNDLLPDYKQLKESSHCCGVEMLPEKPKIEYPETPIDFTMIKDLADKMRIK